MYDEKPQNQFIKLISIFLSEYLVWLVVIFVCLMWLLYPKLLQEYGQFVLFIAPVTILIFSLIIILIKTKIKTKYDEEKGITQYDITITKGTLYLADFIIYGGSILILALPYIFKNGVDAIDLLQAIIYFIMAKWLKYSFYNKIIK